MWTFLNLNLWFCHWIPRKNLERFSTVRLMEWTHINSASWHIRFVRISVLDLHVPMFPKCTNTRGWVKQSGGTLKHYDQKRDKECECIWTPCALPIYLWCLSKAQGLLWLELFRVAGALHQTNTLCSSICALYFTYHPWRRYAQENSGVLGKLWKKDEKGWTRRTNYVITCCYMSQIGNLSRPFSGCMWFQVGYQSYFSRAPMANC